jgi:hypothetical protein
MDGPLALIYVENELMEWEKWKKNELIRISAKFMEFLEFGQREPIRQFYGLRLKSRRILRAQFSLRHFGYAIVDLINFVATKMAK